MDSDLVIILEAALEPTGLSWVGKGTFEALFTSPDQSASGSPPVHGSYTLLLSTSPPIFGEIGFSGGSSTWVLFCIISLKMLAKSFRLTGASEPAEASEGLAEGVVGGASSAVSSDPAEGELKKDMIHFGRCTDFKICQ